MAGLALLLVCLVVPARAAFAQGAPRTLHLFYGIAGGPGRRTTSGSFATSELPPEARQPASDRTIATLNVHGGIRLTKRAGVLALWDQTFGGNAGEDRWGATAAHVAGRVWMSQAIWVEAGAGLAELGYKPAGRTGSAISRFWAPGVEVAAGGDLVSGPRVALTAVARYETGAFHGLRIHTVCFQVGLTGTR